MGKPLADLTGQRFGRLVVIARDPTNYRGNAVWRCACDCGTSHVVPGMALRRGAVQSCGCLRREERAARSRTHGMSNTPEHRVWRGMQERCYNARRQDWPDYGGRGITVCDRWRDSFETFLADMGPRPSPKHSVDRIDNAKGYEPGNCRWATATEQARNRRNVKLDEVAAMQIRWLVGDGGYSTRRVAHAFGVSNELIKQIVSGRIWKESPHVA